MFRQSILNHLKNLPGWRTNRRLVVINVDDYGNVRLASKEARAALEGAGVIGVESNRFDRYDALETREDLEALYEVLTSVQDRHGNHAVFTAYALSANPDFQCILDDLSCYRHETLPNTFERLSEEQPASYDGAWDLWKEGIDQGLLMPQFHGREHINLELFEKRLERGELDLRTNLEQGSLVGLRSDPDLPGIGYTAAFAVSKSGSIEYHKAIIGNGLSLFEQVFGFKSKTFTPPAQQLHPDLYSFLETLGILAIDKPLRCRRHLGQGAYKGEINWLGRKMGQNHWTIVRNVVFEPTEERGYDPVHYAIDQVAAAFRMKRPAIISSHRVNFSGHIEIQNRTKGLRALKQLLNEIVQRWPDVEFISADQLVHIMADSKS